MHKWKVHLAQARYATEHKCRDLRLHSMLIVNVHGIILYSSMVNLSSRHCFRCIPALRMEKVDLHTPLRRKEIVLTAVDRAWRSACTISWLSEKSLRPAIRIQFISQRWYGHKNARIEFLFLSLICSVYHCNSVDFRIKISIMKNQLLTLYDLTDEFTDLYQDSFYTGYRKDVQFSGDIS